MKLTRLRIWGIKDSQRIYVDQQGPVLTLDPEVPSIREAEDVEAATRAYVDTIVDVWSKDWDSDKRMQEWANAWNKHDKGDIPVLRNAEEQRQMYRDNIEFRKNSDFWELSPELEQAYEAKIAWSDEMLETEARAEYDYDVKHYNQVYDIPYMRKMEYDDFVRNNQGPPWDWGSIESYMSKTDQGQVNLDGRNARNSERKQTRAKAHTAPTQIKLCRDCLQPCWWIWYECFPGPLCGSAGWVAICEPCKTWHKEITCIMS